MSLFVDIRLRRQEFCLKVKFETGENEVLGVLGSSGCGKSMTLKCIAGIEMPDCGRIVLNGRVLFDSVQKINLSPQARNVGYLFQNYALFPHMTVEENIAAGIKTKNKKVCIDRYIKMFYLKKLETRYPRELSGGQQQRVALARIFASAPEILMLDEPFSALDSYLKWQVENELARVLQDYQKTVLFVSHDRDEVYRFCDKIAVLAQGRIECVSSKNDVFHAPQSLAASKLTGCKNHSRIRIIDGVTIEAIEWGIILHVPLIKEAVKEPEYVGIRSHDIKVVDDLLAVNTFAFEVVQRVEDMFSFVLMVKYTEDSSPLRVEFPKENWQNFGCIGGEIYLTFPEPGLFLLVG
jgi:molybdate transport system ATP-binding protein